MSLLVVDGLRTHFDVEGRTARAVDGVSFRIDEGETVGLVGESGCGKSVTALSLLGLVPSPPGRILPESSIRYRGEELVGAPEARLRRIRGDGIAMIFQEPMSSLNPVFTVGDQVAEVLREHRGMGRREARGEVVRLLTEVGIPDPGDRVDEHPHRLSGGMRQRVMIAMALACDPDLLIADEPTTALDVTVQAQILDLLGDLRERRGLALLLITHDLGVVAEVCRRVMVMYAGEIVEEAGVEELFRDPRHPYTRGLLASVPRAGGREGRLRPIPGVVPDPTRWPEGCRFHDRCPYAWERCAGEHPPLLPAPDGGVDRCWLEEEPGRRRPLDEVLDG